MKLFLLLLAVGAAWAATVDVRDLEIFAPMSQELINFINSRASGSHWKAGRNFVNMRPEDVLPYVTGMCGAKPGGPVLEPIHHEVTDLPVTFDGRTAWPNCPTLKEVRDQGACGSCWAFGMVEAGTDRICIQSKGQVSAHLSAEDLNSCCHTCGMGCNGGFLSGAWEYFKHDGLVTGGQYNSKQGCMPYMVKACDHHVVGKLQPCGDVGPTPRCEKKCESSYNRTFDNDRHYAKSTYSVRGVKDVMTEIMTNGPVEAAFTVYQDFLAYKTGVYHHVSGPPLGGHAIKILGWGNEDNMDYWLVANSWNPDWGDAGFFKIKRGDDECGIESNIVAGMIKL